MKRLSQYITERYNQIEIFEGGASGHMLHPFDVNEFTGADIEDLIRSMFGGKIEGMTEKMDGFGMQASMNPAGEVVFIRNKTDLNSEKGGMTIGEFATKWKENPTALKNYTTGGRIIEAVFKKIGPKFFNPSEGVRVVANCECIIEGTTNTIPYASDQVDFHNLWIYKHNGIEWLCDEVTKKGLDVLEKACEGIDNVSITPNVIIKYTEDAQKLEKKWLNKWNEFLKSYKCSPEMTIEAIKTSLFYFWVQKNHPWIMDDGKESGVLCRRWIFGEKRDWKNTRAIYQDHDAELVALDKKSSKVSGDALEPLQVFFYGLGADLIKITDGFINKGKDQTVKALLNDLKTATEKIRKEGSLEDNVFLQKWLDILQDIGEENVSSAEGIVFTYKGKMMKWTGGFVPLNRIIGYSKYSMTPKTLKESLFDLVTDTTQTMESLFDKDLISKDPYKYHPETKSELREAIITELKEQGPDANLNIIDVSDIKDMSYLFSSFDINNIDISLWDVSKVTDMSYMFYGCERFNSDLSKWNVGKVTDMCEMFYGCVNFNSNLSKWNVRNVIDMSGMFYECKRFNSDLSKWNVRNVIDMCGMFCECKRFNSDLSKWNVGKVTDMNLMFNGCSSLKKIPNWVS